MRGFRTLTLVAAGGSMALLAGAFAFQAMGYPPCHLCLWQRWPHAAALLIGVVVWLSGWRKLCWRGAWVLAGTDHLHRRKCRRTFD
jgi:disulfide bond formation protein DsbB